MKSFVAKESLLTVRGSHFVSRQRLCTTAIQYNSPGNFPFNSKASFQSPIGANFVSSFKVEPTSHDNSLVANNDEGTANIVIHYTPGSGSTGDGLTVPSTALTGHCNILAESLSKAEELALQKKAQEVLGTGAEVITSEMIDEMIEELQEMATNEMDSLTQQVSSSPALLQHAGMHELRRTLYYVTSLKSKGWLDTPTYTNLMRALTVEFLRRDNNGVLAPDDVLYVATHIITANFYNRHLWNRLESTMEKPQFESIDLPTIKALTTKLFKTRRGCPKETMDVRRKILSAMVRRISVFANEFDLPSLLGILQCYTVHDMTPFHLEPLAIRATNHIKDFTPQECATLSHILRKFRLMRFEVCERLIDQICSADELNAHMASSALVTIRSCWLKVSDSGRNALHAEPTKQKLRAMGELVGSRLDEVQLPNIYSVLNVLDIIVTIKIYVPKKPLQSIFQQAENMLNVVLDPKNDLVDPSTGKRVKQITLEEGRQLQALLLHYGSDLCPSLSARLKEAFRDGLLPDEASI